MHVLVHVVNLRPSYFLANSATRTTGAFLDLREHDRIDGAMRGFRNDSACPAIFEIQIQRLLGSSNAKSTVKKNVRVILAQSRGQPLDIGEMTVFVYSLRGIFPQSVIQLAVQRIPELTLACLIDIFAVGPVATDGSING